MGGILGSVARKKKNNYMGNSGMYQMCMGMKCILMRCLRQILISLIILGVLILEGALFNKIAGL